jgi:uncharacterized protein DUF4440
VSAGEQGARAEAARANYAAQRQAMVDGDADALGALLAEDFTLTHMTGYRQPKAEWLADVRSGAMTYSAVTDVEVSVDVSGEAPVLTARTRTEATIWGAHGTWPLQLRIRFAFDGTGWRASDTVASTWR